MGIELIVAVLACYRLAELITLDDGPFDLFLNLRVWLGVYDRDATGRAITSWGRLFGCPYCIGVWIALGLAIALNAPLGLSAQILWHWLAIAGGQAFLESVGGRA